MADSLGRRRLIPTETPNVYDVERAEGNVQSEGDPLNAANMNALETRIATGFSDADAAINGRAAKSVSVNVTLSASSWAGSAAPYTLTVTVPGVVATTNAKLDVQNSVTLTQLDAFENARIVPYSQAANSVTLRAWGDKPTISIPTTFILLG